MSDLYSRADRSRIMSRVRSRDTGPEKIVRSLLHVMGYHFRLHCKNLPGKPDIVLPRHRKVILVHGCFWHGHIDCRRAARPKSNVGFWNEKIESNMARDTAVKVMLEEAGWEVLTLWQCEIKDREKLKNILHYFMEGEALH